MAEVFLERGPEPPLGRAAHPAALAATACSLVHRVVWRESFLGCGGRRVLCRFEAPDAEAVRIALRHAGMGAARVWAGTICWLGESGTANVVGERRFATPLTPARLGALAESGRRRQAYQVRLVRAFLSMDRLRLLSLYRAPDPAAVCAAEARAPAPLDSVWGCRWVAAPPAGIARGVPGEVR